MSTGSVLPATVVAEPSSVGSMIDVADHLFTELLSLPDRIFTRQDARAMGIRDDVLTAALSRGVIVRICRGVYTAPHTWTKEEHRHLLARAALRAYPDAVLFGATAVAAHEIPLFEVPVVRGDIGRPIAREARTEHLRIRPLRHDPVETAWGPATDLASALVQLTMDHGITAGVASIDAALQCRAITEDDLDSAYEQVRGWPLSSRVRCALAWSDGDSESLGESVTRIILLAAGWQVTSQVPVVNVRGELIARADLGIEGTKVLIEFDGKVKYAEGERMRSFARRSVRIASELSATSSCA